MPDSQRDPPSPDAERHASAGHDPSPARCRPRPSHARRRPLARRDLLAAAGALSSLSLAGCLGSSDGGTTTATVGADGLELTSPAFDAGGAIPTRHTCDGENVSPPLSVSGVADEVESLALVVDDPDAPRAEPFVHWLLWNLPPDTGELPAGVPRGGTVDALGARQGTNDHGDVGYFGPCPPRDDGAHTYRFTLTALDATLDVEPGANRPALDAAMADHASQRVTLRGTYDRTA
ncbi:MAG: YbhB/YbcL family Raf kinase inhibitor-like protein [Haloarculaceae archaeon]